MAVRKVLTTDLGVLENFPNQLATEVAGSTAIEIQNKLKSLAIPGRFAPFVKDVKVTDFRKILESFAPLIYFVNYPQLKQELNLLKQTAIELTKRGSKGALEKQIEESLAGRDVEQLDEIIGLIIDGVKEGVREFIAKSKPKKITYTKLGQQIISINQLGLGKSINNYPYRLLGRIGPGISEAFVFSDYSEVGDKLGRRINENIQKKLTSGYNITKLKNILILGHAAARTVLPDNVEEFYAATPKLTQILLEKVLDSAITSVSAPPITVESIENTALEFLDSTGQLNPIVSIEVTKDFSDKFLKIFIKAGGQILRGESAIGNSARSALERLTPGLEGGQNSIVLNKLSLYYKNVNNAVTKTINSTVKEVLVSSLSQVARNSIKNQGSPSLITYFGASVRNILQDKNTSPYSKKNTGSGKTNFKNITKITTKNIIKPKVVSKKLVLPKTSLPRLPSQAISNLPKLLDFINSSLREKIRQNMGTGDRRDVLNYRTGRFASSVKVERLSESRQGMITAFYSYMKNPYATFSQGGRQELPRSRDPKLLISKSIRDIASTLVANRLRAVSL